MSSFEGFTLLEDVEFKKVKIRRLISEKSKLHVIFAQCPSPYVKGYFVLPTEAASDHGLPHTLEHLIFMGSESYPQRNILDVLAVRCLCPTTNAWTAVDHTCYTVEFAGSEGIERILPVYLDHILYPLLKDDFFTSEVHAVTAGGEDQGVVFCEMAQHDANAEELAYMAVHQSLFTNQECGYRFNTGGKCDALRRLDNAMIKKYHSKLYRPENLYLIIIGAADQKRICEVIKEFELRVGNRNPRYLSTFTAQPDRDAKDFDIPWKSNKDQAHACYPRSLILTYPSDIPNLCNVYLAFRGPRWEDHEVRLAVDILGEFLTDSAAAPLQKRLIEVCGPPIADGDTVSGMNEDTPFVGNLGFEAENFKQQLLSFHFDSVMVEKWRQVKPIVLRTLMDVCTGGAADVSLDINRIEAILDLQILESSEEFESDCHDTIAERLIPYIVNSADRLGEGVKESTSGSRFGAAINPIPFLAGLKNRGREFWIGLLKTWFVDNITMTEICLLPSEIRAKQIEVRDERLKRARAKIVTSETAPTKQRGAEHEEVLKAAVAMGPVCDARKINLLDLRVDHSAEWLKAGDARNDAISGILNGIPVPASFVDTELEGQYSFASDFIDMSVLVSLPEDVLSMSLSETIKTLGTKTEKKEHKMMCPAVIETIKDFERTRIEQTQIQNKPPQAVMAGNTEADLESSEWEETEPDENELEESAFEVLSSFAFESFPLRSLLPLAVECIFRSNLLLSKDEMSRLNITASASQDILQKTHGDEFPQGLKSDQFWIPADDVSNMITQFFYHADAFQGISNTKGFEALCHLNLQHAKEKFDLLCLDRFFTIVRKTHLSEERLAVNAKKLLTRYQADRRNARALIKSFTDAILFKSSHDLHVKTLPVQITLMKLISVTPERFMVPMRILLAKLVNSLETGTFGVHLTCNRSDLVDSHVAENLAKIFGKKDIQDKKRTVEESLSTVRYPSPVTAIRFVEAKPEVTCPTLQVITAPSIESTFVVGTAPFAKFSRKTLPDYANRVTRESWALKVVAEYCSSSQGPLFNSLRGEGFSYGVGLAANLDLQQWRLTVGPASKGVEAWKLAIRNLKKVCENARTILEGKEPLTKRQEDSEDPFAHIPLGPSQTEFENSKGSLIASIVAEVQSPADVAEALLSLQLMRVPPNLHSLAMKHVQEVTYEEFLKALVNEIGAFVNYQESDAEFPSGRFVVCVCPPSKADSLTQSIIESLPKKKANECQVLGLSQKSAHCVYGINKAIAEILMSGLEESSVVTWTKQKHQRDMFNDAIDVFMNASYNEDDDSSCDGSSDDSS